MIRKYENEHEVDLSSNDDEHYEEYTRDRHPSMHIPQKVTKSKSVEEKYDLYYIFV